MNTESTAQAQAEPTTEPQLPSLSLSLDEISKDLYETKPVAPEHAPAPDPKPAPEAKAPETPDKPTEEPPKAEQPPETPKAAGDETPADEETKRVRLKLSGIELEAVELQRRLKAAGEVPPSLKDAIELVEVLREKNKPAATPSQAAPVIEERNALEEARTAAETELAEVSAKLEELAEAESPYTKELQALQDRKTALSGHLDNIQGRHEARIASVRNESRAAAIEMFPGAGDSTTALGRQINADIAEMKANLNHPDRALLTLESAPEAIASYSANKLAAQLAKQQGITKSAALQTLMAKPEAKAPTPENPATLTKKVAPVSGAASTKTDAPKAEPWNAADPKTFKPEAYDDLYRGNKGLIFRLG